MGSDQSHTHDRSYTRRRFFSAGLTGSAALYLAACGGSSSSSSSSSSTAASHRRQRHAQQPLPAAGRLQRVRPGGDDGGIREGQPQHQGQQHPGRLRGAARQDRVRRPGRNLRRRPGRRDLAGRVRLQGDRQGHHRPRQHPADEADLPGRAGDGQLPEQVLRDAVDPRHQVHVRQRLDAEEGRRVAVVAEDLGRRRRGPEADQGQGPGQVPVAGQLGAGRGSDLRLRTVARGVRREVPGRVGQARVPDRRRACRRCSS